MIVALQFITLLLNGYKADLDNDYETYHNHCQRIYYNAVLMDSTEANKEKYAIAATFHDLGIWTANTFDYLDPSIELCKQYLIANHKANWIDEITLMIDMHHKRSYYKGEYELTVETFRKADWIDVTKRLKKYNANKKQLKIIKKSFKNKGFHRFLAWQSVKNFFKHPLNPLPMFKK